MMLNSLSLRNIQQKQYSSIEVINQVIIIIMILVKTIGRRGVIEVTRNICVSGIKSWKYQNSSNFMTNVSLKRNAMTFSFSVQNKQQEDSRKFMQIIENIIPNLLQKQDFATIVEVIHMMALNLFSQSFTNNKSERKKALLFIFKLIDQLEPHLDKNEIQSITKTLKILAQNIDQTNDTDLIIKTDQMYVKFIQKKNGKSNLTYISALSKLAQNCISGDKIDRAFECLSEIEQLSQAVDVPLQVCIQNKINLGIAYLSIGKSQQAIQAYKKALQLSQKGKEQQHLQVYRVAITQCLGDIYKDRMQLELALSNYEEALVTSNLCFSEININTLIMMFKAAKVYFQLKRYEDALVKCQNIQKELKSNSNLLEQFENHEEMLILMGEINLKLSRPIKSIQNFQEYIANAEKSIILQQRQYSDIINRLIDLHLQQRNYQSALKHLKSLTKYYKIQGNESAKESCEDRANEIYKLMKIDKNMMQIK